MRGESPPLDAWEGRQAEQVRSHIAGQIAAAGGWLGFERFMELALYAPGLGYYSAGARKLGAGGDFTTAPEVSPLFGACLAQFCSGLLDEVADGSILEVGAGTGRLAVDMLTRLESLGRLPRRYSVLETSADLRDRQRTLIGSRIPHLLPRVDWLDSPPAAGFDGVIVANEVLDALPVARFRWSGACEELGVVVAGSSFAWAPRPASEAMREACLAFASAAGGWDDGYVSEYCPRLAPWTRSVTAGLRRGAVLWLDYGLPRSQYYLPERQGGTLICHHRQRAHDDPFRHPGLEDISAWVDFTALADASAVCGFELAGFTTQTYLLAALGIDREIQRLAGTDQASVTRLAQQAKQLMLPGAMGESFKAMVWARGVDRELPGFGLRDFRHSL